MSYKRVTISRLQVIWDCYLMLSIIPSSRDVPIVTHGEKLVEEWESAIDSAIMLANDRYIKISEVPHSYVPTWTEKEEIEDLVGKFQREKLDRSSEIERCIAGFDCLSSPQFSVMQSKGAKAYKIYEELQSALYDLQDHTQRIYDIFESINGLIVSISTPDYPAEVCKEVKMKLESIGVKTTDVIENTCPLKAETEELEHYRKVFPEIFEKWKESPIKSETSPLHFSEEMLQRIKLFFPLTYKVWKRSIFEAKDPLNISEENLSVIKHHFPLTYDSWKNAEMVAKFDPLGLSDAQLAHYAKHFPVTLRTWREKPLRNYIKPEKLDPDQIAWYEKYFPATANEWRGKLSGKKFNF